MAVKKAKGVKSHNYKRYINDVEVKPIRFVHTGGRNILAGTVDGEIIMDQYGNPVPFHNIDCDFR